MLTPYARGEERAELRHLLLNGTSVLMLAPRRVGKTWVMRRLEEDMASASCGAVFCDVEGMSDETEFLKHLCDQIQAQESMATRTTSHVGQRLKQLLSEGGWSTVQEAIGKINWKSFSEALVRSLNTHANPTLILIDELSLFVMAQLRRDQAAALDFLHHLRGLRQRYTNVRWLFTGSVGLDTIARRATLSGALLGLMPFSIEPFSRPVARSFLDDFSQSGRAFRPFELADESFSHLSSELGWLAPYYLEQLGNVIRPTGAIGVSKYPIVTVADVNQAFETLLSPQCRIHFAAWEEHLTKNFERDDQNNLHTILAACANSPQGEQFTTIQSTLNINQKILSAKETRELLAVLVSDGFFDHDGTRYRFRSGLVRRYWLKYHMD
jgi:uncharacterized protein